MKGKLGIKSKVLHSVRSRNYSLKRRIKKERSNTPQRWSRRIRSLPPISVSSLESNRRIKKSKSVVETGMSIPKISLKSSRKKIGAGGDKKVQVVYKNTAPEDIDTIETLRIVPVVVYVKNKKATFQSLSEDIEIQIRKKCSSGTFNKTLQDSLLHKKIKQECSTMERRWSQRLRINDSNFGRK